MRIQKYSTLQCLCNVHRSPIIQKYLDTWQQIRKRLHFVTISCMSDFERAFDNPVTYPPHPQRRRWCMGGSYWSVLGRHRWGLCPYRSPCSPTAECVYSLLNSSGAWGQEREESGESFHKTVVCLTLSCLSFVLPWPLLWFKRNLKVRAVVSSHYVIGQS